RLTLEDISNPHDFPELADPDWQYEDGVLTGVQTVLAAVRARRREGPPGEEGEAMASKKKGAAAGPFDALRALKDELKKKDEAQKATAGAPRRAPPPPP